MPTGILASVFGRAPGLELNATDTGALCIDTPALGLTYGRAAAWSSDSTMLAITHDTNPNLIVLDTVTGETSAPTSGIGTSNAVAFSPDGTLLAAGRGGTPYLSVFPVSTLAPIVLSGGNPTGIVWGCAWSPDGALLAVAYNTSPYLTVYNTATWAKVSITGGNPPSGSRGISFSSDGSKLAVGHTGTPYLTVYETSTWAKLDTSAISLFTAVLNCAFSPDGTKLAVTAGSTMRAFSVSGWSEITITDPIPEASTVYSLDWSADGSALAVSYNAVPYVSVYNTSTWEESRPFAQGEKGGLNVFVRYSRGAAMQPKYIGTTAAHPITDENGAPVAAAVRLYSRASGKLLTAVTADAAGAYSAGPLALSGETQVVFLDPGAEPLQNDLIHRVIPA